MFFSRRITMIKLHKQTIKLANPRGFCAGVERAVEIVERALEKFGSPMYVHHEIVHNEHVVAELRAKGVIFVNTLDEVPDNTHVIFSAHGVSQSVRSQAQTRGLQILDATCPLVTKVHVEVARMHADGDEIIMIGHKGHPEVEGTLGQLSGCIVLIETIDDVVHLQVHDADKLAYVTQTTLSVDDASAIIDALIKRFPNIKGPKKDDICYATQNRQQAVKELAQNCDTILVIGSRTSSNSQRLHEVAKHFVPSFMIEDADDIDPEWLLERESIGITSGASVPEVLVRGVISRLEDLGITEVHEEKGVREQILFPLPELLRR